MTMRSKQLLIICLDRKHSSEREEIVLGHGDGYQGQREWVCVMRKWERVNISGVDQHSPANFKYLLSSNCFLLIYYRHVTYQRNNSLFLDELRRRFLFFFFFFCCPTYYVSRVTLYQKLVASGWFPPILPFKTNQTPLLAVLGRGAPYGSIQRKPPFREGCAFLFFLFKQQPSLT